MRKIENLFIGVGLFAVIAVTGSAIWEFDFPQTSAPVYEYQTSKFGTFLASQHAIYINDFDGAAKFSDQLEDREIPIVRNTVLLADFLNGRLPEGGDALKDEAGSAAQLIYEANLIQNNDWKGLYARHKKDESAIAAPLRIWSGIATGNPKDTLKFISKLNTNESWKSFTRGMIYAETNQIDKAVKEFENVSIDFMNINDYMYLIAFYNHNDMADAAEQLREDFTSRPGGMYMLNVKLTPQWSDYSGYHNALAFSLIQNVSHTQIMMYSDLSLLMLRFAQIANQGKSSETNAINYYLGQYFFNNGGDYESHFNVIDQDSPFYSFAAMKIAEKTGKIAELEKAARANPLFVPATNKLVSKYVQNGDKRRALRTIDRALKNENTTETGRAFFLKTRAQIYLAFGDLESAQTDIYEASKTYPMDTGVLAIQSRIWAAEGRELETAYEYAIALVKRSPADIESWDVLGRVVAAREGATAGLEVIERVGQIAQSCSSLFEALGDLYDDTGDTKRATDAYLRAIDLSDDGMVVVPKLNKKIKRLK